MRLRRNANCIKERFGATAPAPTKGRLGGTVVAAPFYLWFVKELCHFSINRCSVHTLTSGQRFFLFYLLEVLEGFCFGTINGEFFRFRYACLRAVHSVGYT